MQVPRPAPPGAEQQRLREITEQVVLAEEMGFEHVWFVEHHFLTEWAHSSAPEVMLAVLSQHTTKMRLGFGVVARTPSVARGGQNGHPGHNERRPGGRGRGPRRQPLSARALRRETGRYPGYLGSYQASPNPANEELSVRATVSNHCICWGGKTMPIISQADATTEVGYPGSKSSQ